MEDRRLLVRVALGEAETTASAGLLGSSTLILVSVSPEVSSLSRVLLTAARTTGEGVES